MRRRAIVYFLGFAGAISAGQACALSVTLERPALLRAGPGARYRVLAALPASATVDILRDGRVWSRVEYDGLRGYASASWSVGVATQATPFPPAPVDDPTCDYGYPYSGSGAYFTGLTELRHSGPLGALLGYHRRWPC